MFVTIRQIQANGKNLFQVEGEGSVLFRAQTPWADITAPLQLENLRKLTFTDAGGRELFHTDYHVLENTLQALSRYKYLFGASTKLGEYQVLDREGTEQGSFYTRIDGVLTTQMAVGYRGGLYDCYTRAVGKIYVISIFDGERQIGQITKSLDTWDRLDIFYLHLDDAYRDLLPILSFFTVYVDAQRFNRPGRYSRYEVEKAWSYTFDRNNDRYDPDWIRNTFGQEAAHQLSQLLRARPERSAADLEQVRKMKRRILGILTALGVGLAVCVAVMAVLLFRPKTALTAEDFGAQMSGYGYTVTAQAPAEAADGWEQAYRAQTGGYDVWYLRYATEEEAGLALSRAEEQFAQNRGDAYDETRSHVRNREKYALTVGGTYSVASRIDNTLILCIAPEERKENVEELFRDLGY